MIKEQGTRTGKVFEDYNDYHDRGIGQVADCVRNGRVNKLPFYEKEVAMGAIYFLPQMNAFEIDKLLRRLYC